MIVVGNVKHKFSNDENVPLFLSCSTSFMTGEKLRSLLPDAKKEWEKWKSKRIERIGELEKSVETLKKNVKRTGISIN